MNNIYGPFDVAPRVVQRSTNLIDLIIQNRPGTDMYRLWGAKSVDDAYGNLTGSGVGTVDPTLMMTTMKDTIGQSPSIISRRVQCEENRRGQTSFQFDMDDFVAPAVPPPFRGDDFPVYVRLQEYRAGVWTSVVGPVNNGHPILGPILVVPPVNFYGQSISGTLNIAGTAPVGTGCTQGEPPLVDLSVQTPTPMHIVLPKTCTNILITPQTAGKAILVSFGLHDPMIEIQNSYPFTMDSSRGIHEIILAANTDAAPFTIHAVMAHLSN